MCFAMLQLLCLFFSDLQPGANDVHILFWCGYSAFALFLKTVKDKHCFDELYGIDGAVCTASVVLNDFQNTSSTEAFERLRGIMAISTLSEVEGVTKKLPYVERKRQQILLAVSYPDERFFTIGHI